MKVALEIAKASKAINKKVGALLVKNNNIISFGYNGTPTGFDNKCEFLGKTLKEVLHAESNAITKCVRSYQNCDGAILYTTLSPCYDCAKLIIQSGIIKVYYLNDYKDLSGIFLLKKAGIVVEKLFF
jgi:dCMP deaminase